MMSIKLDYKDFLERLYHNSDSLPVKIAQKYRGKEIIHSQLFESDEVMDDSRYVTSLVHGQPPSFYNVAILQKNKHGGKFYTIILFRLKEVEFINTKKKFHIKQIWEKEPDVHKDLDLCGYPNHNIIFDSYLPNIHKSRLIFHSCLGKTSIKAYTKFYEENDVIYLQEIEDWIKIDFKQIFEYPKNEIRGEKEGYPGVPVYYILPLQDAMWWERKWKYLRNFMESKGTNSSGRFKHPGYHTSELWYSASIIKNILTIKVGYRYYKPRSDNVYNSNGILEIAVEKLPKIKDYLS